MADQSGFDLRSESWISVRTLDGIVEDVSLQDVFRRSGELQGLVGEVSSQVPVMLRLLLAMLLRAVPWDRKDIRGHWFRAWNGEVDLAAAIDGYLQTWGERFDLLHPTTPFLQVADLRTRTDGFASLTSLIADVPNNAQYFTTRAGRDLESITLSEAARWLVHTHGFDLSGIKSGAVDDPRVKGGKGYPIGTGWVGQLGCVLVEGSTLRETLLLNLVLEDRDGQPWPIDDLPVWERNPLGPGVEGAGDRVPDGLADQFTWPSRRIRLQVRDGRATGVLIANGDPLAPQNRFLTETMTGWRRSTPQEKKLKMAPVYMPRTHQPDRAFWRGLEALLAQIDSPAAYREAAAELSPAVLSWLATLQLDSRWPRAYVVRTRAIGIAYGSQSSVIDQMMSDSLILHAVVLGEQGNDLRLAAVAAVKAAENAVRSLADLAGNLGLAAGGEADGPRERARELGFFGLDGPFRRWLENLSLNSDIYDIRAEWERQVRSIAWNLADELVQNAGIPAWIGRDHRGRDGQSRYINSSLAVGWFQSGLRKALPFADSASTDPARSA